MFRSLKSSGVKNANIEVGTKISYLCLLKSANSEG